ncbi:hypothetical protein BH11PLA2_BH11PLA2_15420 [soil metagenome]
MASPNLPPDPPPSISAAELRRRLLSSTPPPLGSGGSTATLDLEPEPLKAGSGPISTEELLRKLRMPAHVAPTAPQESVAVNKRTPMGMSTGSAFSGGFSEPPIGESPSAELHRLRSENKEIRQLLGEMKMLLQEASDTEQEYARQLEQAQAKLEENALTIEQLTSNLQQIEDQISNGELAPALPAGPPKTRTELEEWSDELEKEASVITQTRKQMQDDRKQLREDEEALEKQMRDMEVSMARERALMARQETELKRLSAEIQHELELMQRGDASLREQMQKFQRRAQEVLSPQRPMPGSGGSGSTQWPKRQ